MSEISKSIAICGIGCRFANGVNDVNSLWNLLINRQDAISEVPADRWNAQAFYHTDPSHMGLTNSKWGGFVDGIDQFDPAFFGISEREAGYIDPQQRMLLEAVWESIEDGGYDLEKIRTYSPGVFVGIATIDYATMHVSPVGDGCGSPYAVTGTSHSIAANRISYSFDFDGPSYAIDTACSSSLIAVHLACESLLRGECRIAFAGGVNSLLLPSTFIGLSNMSALAPDGRCKAFDASADGFARGEGVGMVALRPLEDALADGDRVYGVILATGTNQDGATKGLAYPNEEAQVSVVQDTMNRAGIRPDEIRYVEAHGTGTAVGDLVETASLGRSIGKGRKDDEACVIGSIKTNVGHLEAGAGIAGLIKCALILQKGIIPANLHFKTPNPKIDFERLGLRVAAEEEPLPGMDGESGPVLGVNSFGFGGSNSFALLGRVPDAGRKGSGVSVPQRGGNEEQLLVLSARTTGALGARAAQFAEMLCDTDEKESLERICLSAMFRQTHHEKRLVVRGSKRAEISEKLEEFSSGGVPEGVVTGTVQEETRPVFVFSGQGAQWFAMGRKLYEGETVFREKLLECGTLLHDAGAPWSLIDELMADESDSRLADTAIAQPAIFAVQVAQVALWESWGIRPSAVVGHSVGEVAAAHVAGALTLQQAVRVIYHRGRCMSHATGDGGMLAAGLTEEEAVEMIKPFGDKLSLASLNGPFSVAISGQKDALSEIDRDLENRERFHKFVPVEYAFHSAQMDPAREELLKSLRGLSPSETTIPIVSTVTGALAEGADFDAAYWWENVRKTVRFSPAISALADMGYRVFVENAAHPVLRSSIQQCLEECGSSADSAVIPTMRRNENDRDCMNDALSRLHCIGFPVKWAAIHGEKKQGFLVDLPKYPWQKKRYWEEVPLWERSRLRPADFRLEGWKIEDPKYTRHVKLDRGVLSYFNDHRVGGRVVLPAAAYVEMAAIAGLELFEEERGMLEGLSLIEPVVFDDTGSDPILQVQYDSGDQEISIHGGAVGFDEWTFQGSAKLEKLPEPAPPVPVDIEAVWNRCTARESSAAELYASLREWGLDYGRLFQGVTKVRGGEREAIGNVRLPRKLRQEFDRYIIHPVMIDAAFHVTSAVFPVDKTQIENPVFMPVSIDRVVWHRRLPDDIWVHVEAVSASLETLVFDLRLLDRAGNVVMEIDGFRCEGLPSGSGIESGIKSLLYETVWEEKALLSNQKHRVAEALTSELLPDSVELANQLRAEVESEHSKTGFLERAAEIREIHTKLWGCYEEAAAQDKLDEEGEKQIGALIREALERGPEFHVETLLFSYIGRNLAGITRGAIEPSELIQDGPERELFERWQSEAIAAKTSHLILRKSVELLSVAIPETSPLRILEVEGAESGIFESLQPALRGQRCDYCISDSRPASLSAAMARHSRFEFLTSLEADFVAEGDSFPDLPEQFHLVITSIPTADDNGLERWLQNIRGCMRPGALLFVAGKRGRKGCEATLSELFGSGNSVDSSGELLDGRLPAMLQSAGFVDVEGLCGTGSDPDWEDSLLVAKASPEVLCEDPENDLTDARGRWLLIGGPPSLAESIANRIEKRGGDVTRVPISCVPVQERSNSRMELDDGIDHEAIEKVIQKCVDEGERIRGVVHLGAIDATGEQEPSLEEIQRHQESSCHVLLRVLNAITDNEGQRDLPRLSIVTRSAQPGVPFQEGRISISAAPVLGLSRVIANEMPGVRCHRIDLPLKTGAVEISGLVDELVLEEEKEDEIALRGESRYVQRVVPATIYDRLAEFSDGESYRVEIGSRGSLDGIVFRPLSRRTPEEGEIEIEVKAAGVNFRDVMKVLGMYPKDAPDAIELGDECSGIVVGVGPGTTEFQVGDRVVASISGSFASHITISEKLAMPLPSDFTFEEGATVLVNYTTAHYALKSVGHMESGERVLIHAGAGGVGMAAIRIALSAGAEVFATAGNPLKRQLLRDIGAHHVYDSRTLRFADQILEDTSGEGVDLILNSLAGEALKKSMELLGEGGRFLEIGKRDIFGDTRISMHPFRRSTSFHAIDLSQVMRGKKRDSIFEGIRKELETGGICPLPFRTFSIGDTAEAFRWIAQAKHIGKIVLRVDGNIPEVMPSVNPDRLHLWTKYSYLVTGGLRGVGLSMAEWLVSKGARYLILTSRRGVIDSESADGVKRLEERGIKVMARASDVSDSDALRKLLDEAAAEMPPIKGIVHAAAVLSDGILSQMTAEQFEKVMRPKAYGAWNLHCQTKDLQPDLFLMMSSITAINGTPGQGNYSAANAFVDALAHYRRKMGLPGISINWDMIREVGMAARDPEVREHFERIKWKGMSVEQVTSCAERLLMNSSVQVCATTVDWRKFLLQPGLSPDSPRFEKLRAGNSDDDSLVGDGSIRSALASAPVDQRKGLIEEFLLMQVSEMTRTVAEEIEKNVNLDTLGIDSLMGVELLVRIERKLGVALRSSQLMKKPTVSGMAEVIADQIASDEADCGADGVGGDGSVSAGAENGTGELDLVDSIPMKFEDSESGFPSKPNSVFLTGATGFLGAQLVGQLLEQTGAGLRCLIRAESESEATTRLLENLERHSVPVSEVDLLRLEGIPGDLGLPRFGLSESEFQDLGVSADMIFHAGAEVNHVRPYELLRTINVLGTAEVLRLAAVGGAVPVHLMSSVAVFGLAFADQERVFTEGDPPLRGEIPDNGYIETKRVSEELLWRMGEKGLPVNAYRLGLLIDGGHSRNINEDDFLWRVVRASILCGKAPDISGNLYLAPVDCTAKAVVWLATHAPTGNSYHLVGGKAVRFNDLIDAAVSFGFPMERIPMKDWLEGLVQFEWPEEGNPIAPYLAAYPIDWIATFFSQMGAFSSEKTMSILEPSGISWPEFDSSFLSPYFTNLISNEDVALARSGLGISLLQPE